MYLYGASGHCKVVIENLLSINEKIHCVFDDFPKSDTILRIPVKKFDLNENTSQFECIICIGNNKIRKDVVNKIKAEYKNAIHKNAIISNSSKIAEGTVVMAQAVINAEAVIGKHCIINTSSVIEHDCHIEDFVHISPNASLAGGVKIGEGTHVGIGASVIQGIKIGKWVTVGAGTVVIKDIPDYAVVVGNPGKIIKYNNNFE